MLCAGQSGGIVGVGGTGGGVHSVFKSGFDLTLRKDFDDNEGTTKIFVDFLDFSFVDFDREGDGVREELPHAAILLRKLFADLFFTNVVPPPAVVVEYGVVCIIPFTV